MITETVCLTIPQWTNAYILWIMCLVIGTLVGRYLIPKK